MKNMGIIEIDVHGMNQFQTQTMLNSALKKANRGTYMIRVIHGYHNGTTLRQMIRRVYRTHPKVLRIEVSLNQGVTELILRQL